MSEALSDQYTLSIVRGGAQEVARSIEDERANKVEAFLRLARERFQLVQAAEATMRAKQQEDLQFVASEQWAEDVRRERIVDQRPCLTINRLPQFIRQVVNATRSHRPGIEVNPIDSGADPKTAEILMGIIRHIETQSDAQVAYTTAAEAQARIGRGYLLVDTEYSAEDSFAQEIRIKRVRNPFSIYLDPTIQEPDGADARFGFIVEDIPRREYEQRFGDDGQMASLAEFVASGERAQDWMPEGKVRTAAYWVADIEDRVLLLVEWPDRQRQSVYEDVYRKWPAPDQLATKELKRRIVPTKKIKCALINAVEILEGNEDLTDGRVWPGNRIPIIPVIGEEIDLNGELDYRGMVRDAKDPQRLYNFQNTALAETLALAPKAPYVGYAGQFEGFEQQWRQANRRSFAYLQVKPIMVNGQLAPLPQRNVAEPAIMAITHAINQADSDLKATMGLFEPSLGQRQGEQSGKAITALQQQGEMANSNFLDNLSRAIRAVGRIIVDLIPHIYDEPRVMRIIGLDEKPKSVMVHAGAPPNEVEGQVVPDDVKNIYDLSIGRYDVAVSTGPSMASKRQEAVESLTQICSSNEQAFSLLGDLLVENMDWAGADTAAQRLRKALPPELQDEEGEAPIPPKAQAEMAQMKQMGQMQQQQLEEAQQALKDMQLKVDQRHADAQAKIVIAREEIQSKERIEALRLNVEVQLAQLKAQTARAGQMIDLQHEQNLKRADHLHDHAFAQHEADLARQDALNQALASPPQTGQTT